MAAMPAHQSLPATTTAGKPDRKLGTGKLAVNFWMIKGVTEVVQRIKRMRDE